MPAARGIKQQLGLAQVRETAVGQDCIRFDLV
jgi:hypothetical protein